MVGFAGEIAIVLNVAAVMLTVTVVDPVTLPLLAETVTDPLATPVTTPAALTVASLVFPDDQFAVAVRSWLLPSE